jgi:polyhydroxyalkanoate synthesis repressor PhaR
MFRLCCNCVLEWPANAYEVTMADVPSTQPEQPDSAKPVPAQSAVVVKKYANRRLYNTETSSYITLENLAEMIRAGRDFIVFDAKSGDDITRGVLTQIIVEEESKGSAMLPTAFLRQLIGFYGGSLEGVVPRYLEYSMSSFARQQQQVRTVMERTFSPFLPSGVEEMNRNNMALFERAISMWNPFARTGEGSATEASGDVGSDTAVEAPVDHPDSAELAWLRNEVESLRRQLAAAHAAAVLPPAAQKLAIPENVLRDPVMATASNGSKPVRRIGRKSDT